MDKEELFAAKQHFDCVRLVTDINKDDFVIPRYSIYPFPYDQISEMTNIGATSINSYQQHLYIADLQNYIIDLGNLTPRTWSNMIDVPDNIQLVLKGETNSKKSNWNKNMFAANKREAIEVQSRLMDDNLIGAQKIFIREYVPLITYLIGIGGMPITKEFRFFVAYGEVLTGAFYWQNYADELDNVPSIDDVPKTFLQSVINKVGNNSCFYVIDVAQTKDGNWIVIELNCGMQSGLSLNDPFVLYKKLKEVLVSRDVG